MFPEPCQYIAAPSPPTSTLLLPNVLPFIKMIFFKITLLALILNIRAPLFPSIVKPLPSIVKLLVILIPRIKSLSCVESKV